jgi:hypothetical protein
MQTLLKLQKKLLQAVRAQWESKSNNACVICPGLRSGIHEKLLNKNYMALNLTLRKVYLYLFAIVGLILVIISLVSFISLGLRTYVFKKADYPCYHNYPVPVEKTPGTIQLSEEEQKRQADLQKQQCEEQRVSDKQRQASTALAQLIVGLPLYLYHWMLIRKENQV